MNSTQRMAAQVVPSPAEIERVAHGRAARLAWILTDPPRRPAARSPRRAGRWAPLLVAAVVAGALLVTFLVVGPVQNAGGPELDVAAPGQADGVPSDAGTLLRGLADLAAAQPGTGEGRFDYVRTDTWSRQLSEAAGLPGWSPVRREQWTAEDGSGRIVETHTDIETGTSGDYGPGTLSPPLALPTDPAVLERELAPADPGTAAWFDQVKSVWLTTAVEPAGQAALLRVLATQPDMTVLGPTIDPSGRPAVAIATTTDRTGVPVEHVLILDPATGALRGYDERDPGASSFSYTLWLERGHVDGTDERP